MTSSKSVMRILLIVLMFPVTRIARVCTGELVLSTHQDVIDLASLEGAVLVSNFIKELAN